MRTSILPSMLLCWTFVAALATTAAAEPTVLAVDGGAHSLR